MSIILDFLTGVDVHLLLVSGVLHIKGTQALASLRRHPAFIVSVADHKGVHQFLVQSVGDLLCVLEQDLLYLTLSHSRDVPRGLLWRTVTSQYFKAPLHVDHLCVHTRTPIYVTRRLRQRSCGTPRCALIELPSASDAFFASLPVVLIAKPSGLGGSTRTVAAVMPWLTTHTTAVWVGVRWGVAHLHRHQLLWGVGYTHAWRPGLAFIFFCNCEKNHA